MISHFLNVTHHALDNLGLSVANVSGGKPPFPICEFLMLEWYPRSISILFYNFYREVVQASIQNHSNASARSFSDTIETGRGHPIPSFGSSYLTPVDTSGV